MHPGRMLPLRPRDFLILIVLSRGERHGYGIVKEAESHSDGIVSFDPANLYRALRRLMRDGLVKEVGKAPTEESGGAPRRYYALTRFGRQVLSAEAARLARLADTARAWKLIPEGGSGG